MLPPGESFDFVIEAEKLEKIQRVIAHNGGEVIEETHVGEDVRLRACRKKPTE
jgi:hypothetical protein